MLVQEQQPPPGLELLQPRGGHGFDIGGLTLAFHSGVNFASPAGKRDPLAPSGIHFASVMGTAGTYQPLVAGIGFASRFALVGADLANGRYRR